MCALTHTCRNSLLVLPMQQVAPRATTTLKMSTAPPSSTVAHVYHWSAYSRLGAAENGVPACGRRKGYGTGTVRYAQRLYYGCWEARSLRETAGL